MTTENLKQLLSTEQQANKDLTTNNCGGDSPRDNDSKGSTPPTTEPESSGRATTPSPTTERAHGVYSKGAFRSRREDHHSQQWVAALAASYWAVAMFQTAVEAWYREGCLSMRCWLTDYDHLEDGLMFQSWPSFLVATGLLIYCMYSTSKGGPPKTRVSSIPSPPAVLSRLFSPHPTLLSNDNGKSDGSASANATFDSADSRVHPRISSLLDRQEYRCMVVWFGCGWSAWTAQILWDRSVTHGTFLPQTELWFQLIDDYAFFHWTCVFLFAASLVVYLAFKTLSRQSHRCSVLVAWIVGAHVGVVLVSHMRGWNYSKAFFANFCASYLSCKMAAFVLENDTITDVDRKSLRVQPFLRFVLAPTLIYQRELPRSGQTYAISPRPGMA